MTNVTLKHCHFHYSTLTSSITGRTIHFNASAKFCISPTFRQAGLNAARLEWSEHIRALVKGTKKWNQRSLPSIGCPRTTASLIDACFMAKDVKAFGASLDALIDHLQEVENRAKVSEAVGKIKRGRRSGQSSRLLECFTLLWKHELVLFPATETWIKRLITTVSLPPVNERFYGSAAPFVSEIHKRLRYASQRRSVRLLPLLTNGVVEVGDIGPEVISALEPFAPRPPGHTVYGLCDQLLIAQRRAYAKKTLRLEKLPQSYRALFQLRHAPRADAEFWWALEEGGEHLALWRERLAEYLRIITNRVGLRYEVTHFNHLLEYVVADTDIPSSPLDYCRRDFTPRRSFAAYLDHASSKNETGVAATLRATSKFFHWILETDGLDGEGLPLRGYRNPIDPDDIPTQLGSKGQTSRSAIPIRFLRIMREIIESPDKDGRPTYAWPKSLSADYFEWVDPETGKTQREWSPVRSHLFLLRLMLPIRGLQARLLDSGEGDAEVYRPSQGGWIKNTGRLAPARRARKKPTGLVQRIWDHDLGRWFNGLYITTNKTADRAELFMESGYEIPWENQDIIDLFCRMRDWQEKYNPCLRPLSRAELTSDSKLLVSRDLAERLDKLCFLFRDAASPSHPQEPPTDGRLIKFWYHLVAELEDRLAAQGLTNSDGSRIVLVSGRRENGYPNGTIFDPHSLRVAGLTALAGAGVPIHILSQFVAGHATVLMTIYYNKPSAAKITESLDEAWEKLAETESRDWEAYLKGMPLEFVHELAAYNSEEGLRLAAETQSALWSEMDDGICPAGGTKCNIGGPLLNKGKKVYAPVPGGPRNCALCRFFVSGPGYLGGLVAKFNAMGGQIREKLLRLIEAAKRRRNLEAMAVAAEQKGERFSDHTRLALASEIEQGVQDELELLSQTWIAQLKLIKRIESIMKEHRAKATSGKGALVLNGEMGDFRVALEECSEFELWDRICRNSTFYPGVDARLPALRRARLFDTMLSRGGGKAIFVTLSDEQLVEVGNAASEFLRVRLGDAITNDLVAGRETIEALGIGDELQDVIAGSLRAGAPVTMPGLTAH
jgi:hypothetical protein